MPAPSDLNPELDTAAAAEFAVLTTDSGRQLLDAVAAVAHPGPAAIARWRRNAEPPLVAAAIRLVETRRKGAIKFDQSHRMWFSVRGLEQATGEVVARHKARRFVADETNPTVVDLCSGIGGDSIALAGTNRVIAVDLDPAMSARARWNAAVHDVSDRFEAMTARAEAVPIPPAAWVHVDPDRRAASTRQTNTVVAYAPGLDALLGWTKSTRGGAIKLGPASDFANHFGGPGFEVEVISLKGECKEASIWFGDRVTPGVRRRATSLPAGVTWTDRDGAAAAPARSPPVRPLDRWVFDPDPALVRAGLLDGFALIHGLARFEPEVDLLTGPAASSSPLLASFEVVEVFPLDVKVLRREVATRDLGPLEIKTRGLAIRPEAYRALLRPRGSNPATWLLVAGRNHPGWAILARRGEVQS